ncbi:MAG: DUF421 domain-containing protein [Chloroflexi bacterium]|nr:DUF421 domain-containing protein [Chloroflexota bacterium]
MEILIRTAAVYFFLLLLFRIGGKRSLSQITTFDFVLLLIISEAVQQALLGEDFSVINAFLVIATFFAIDIGISILKQRSKAVEKVIDGVPLIILEDGRPIQERMDKTRVDEADILAAARELQGLERLDQIKYAVLERSGGISIIPMPEAKSG